MQKRTRTTKQVVAEVALAFALLCSSVVTTHAQRTTPTSTSPASSTVSPSIPTNTSPIEAPTAFLGVASATGDGSIYFYGGQLNSATIEYSNELFAIDVKVHWNISLPAWSNLTSLVGGGPKVSGHSLAMSKDLSTLYVTAPTGNASNPFLYGYNVKTKAWSAENAPTAQAAIWANRREAQLHTDPNTGALWYLGGSFPSGGLTNEIDKYLSGSWSTNIATITQGAMEGVGSTTFMNKFSSGTSHLVGSKIYVFGGLYSTAETENKGYQSFQSLPWIDISTSTPTIGAQLTLGPVPPPRQDHCSVLTHSQKVIVFGGYDSNSKTSFNDTWSLDLVTLTWQQIVTLNPLPSRYGHTCNIVGANMIVYGGRSTTSAGDYGYLKDIQVYDVTQSAWVFDYFPKEDTTPISKPLPGGPNGLVPQTSSERLPTGAIVGIIFGAVVLVACAIGLFIYRRRQKQIEIKEAEMEKKAYLASLADGQSDGGRRSSSHHRRRRSHRHRNSPYQASTSSPHSTSTRPLNGVGASNTPGHSHYTSSAASAVPGTADDVLNGPIETPGNVQYLMQYLPDGTIAVQPVYLDHQPLDLQHSPNTMYSENSRLAGLIRAPSITSPTMAATNSILDSAASSGTTGASAGSGNDFVPPPPSSASTTQQHQNAPAGSGYVAPKTTGANVLDQTGTGTPTSPTATRDPFMSVSSGQSSELSPNRYKLGREGTAGSLKSLRSSPTSPRTQNHSSSPRQARR
ncbi:hypothetical protein BGX28_004098 [Mortierella sp. GBA30]|nr:hypothetical protein BGX28_004098 [Mortierella sp. GBA30]